MDIDRLKFGHLQVNSDEIVGVHFRYKTGSVTLESGLAGVGEIGEPSGVYLFLKSGQSLDVADTKTIEALFGFFGNYK